ncbi:flavorubredoxin [Desulfobaculum xiamenense]|uniref:Flavorubredoxin n=1 Tax=Desulfobaculum xiamenense TaxID=995050 RepID=A0A846QLV1_9BACT|nr:flavodoxin domain-containing protein [Desulfobaculum xiamenense]NJB68167.1 flavorubredoxin [Desulfobaculum xiamenense]
MRPVEIKKDVFWVGCIDWNGIDFHGYSVARFGTTYNAYLVKDEKITLFDTVKAEFRDEFLDILSQVVNIEDIDYIVANHLEPDHGGLLAELVERAKPEKIFCSPMGQRAIEAHFHPQGWPIEAMKSGSSISLGKRTVQFVETRMLHWPDSMLSYIPEDKLLISNDAFGQNVAASERFADELERGFLKRRMMEYYANIVVPYSPVVEKTLDGVADLKLDIDMIAPDHGVIFRGTEDVNFALDTYREFAEQKPANRAVIVYDTMWHSTEKMAKAIADGLLDEGVSVRIMHLKSYHHSEVMTEVFQAGAVLVGSPTHNNGILPLVADMLTYMKGLRPQNKIGAAFGSFGWSGECVKTITEWLESMSFEMIDPVKTKHVPDRASLDECVELGRAVGKALKAKIGA